MRILVRLTTLHVSYKACGTAVLCAMPTRSQIMEGPKAVCPLCNHDLADSAMKFPTNFQLLPRRVRVSEADVDSGSLMHLSVMIFNGRVLKVHVASNVTVSKLKLLIYAAVAENPQYGPEFQTLLFKTQQLKEDMRSVQSYGIADNSVLHLTQKATGGGPCVWCAVP
jgi:hypothetical protein